MAAEGRWGGSIGRVGVWVCDEMALVRWSCRWVVAAGGWVGGQGLAPATAIKHCATPRCANCSQDGTLRSSAPPHCTAPLYRPTMPQVYRELRHRHAELGAKPSVAVISPYKAQARSSV